MTLKTSLFVSTAALILSACGNQAETTIEADAVPVVDTKTPAEIHESLLVLDSHLDTPANFRNDDYSLIADNPSVLGSVQVDLPKMQRGGLDGGFWVIYTAQGPLTDGAYTAAYTAAMTRMQDIRTAAETYPDDFEIALSASDAQRIVSDGKRIMYISMENSYPIGLDLANIKTFYDLGLRMIGPVHFRDNQFADSATDLSIDSHGGLSDLGAGLVREANRLGMVVDGSHAGDDTVRDIMAISTTPIILTHTGVKAIYDHPRNIDDVLLKEIADDGGVIQINGLGGYLEELVPSAERAAALAELMSEANGREFGDLSPEEQAEFMVKRKAIDATYPAPLSTFDKFMEHLLHALSVVGPDHIGMGADWDGGGGVEGMEDVSYLPKVTAALLEAGYSEEDLAKIWSGNMLRLLVAAEAQKESE